MYTSPLTALQEMIEGSMLAFKLLATFVQAAMHDLTVTAQSFLFDEKLTRAEVLGAGKGIKIKRCADGVGVRCRAKCYSYILNGLMKSSVIIVTRKL